MSENDLFLYYLFIATAKASNKLHYYRVSVFSHDSLSLAHAQNKSEIIQINKV